MGEGPPRVYADTSVYGGVFDVEFAGPSRAFFRQVYEGRFLLVASALVADEIAAGPQHVHAFFDEMLGDQQLVQPTEPAIQLQQAYLASGIVSSRYAADALHVATAAVAGCELLVSWNYRHIVHYDKAMMYNAVSQRCGYGAIGIHSPLEVIEYEEDL